MTDRRKSEPWEPIAEQVRGLIRGQSQDVALAMANQARLGLNPIDPTQVIHLLSIGFAEGYAACMERETVDGRNRDADRTQ